MTQINKISSLEVPDTIDSVEEFLQYLGAPTWIFFPGISNANCRVITTLLHGNEPSGSIAVLRLIKEKYTPMYDTWILIASVKTALEVPVFSNRALPDQQDLNRCFKAPFVSDTEKLAKKIMQDIYEFKPEAVVDIHNTSGNGPGFCVATSSSKQINQISGIFSNSLVITHITLGSLMEVDFNCPVITTECGGNQSELSHLFAYNGIKKFLSTRKLNKLTIPDDLVHYQNPLRLQIKNTTKLTYALHKSNSHDVTLCQSIEEHNFGTTNINHCLGWSDSLDYLTVKDLNDNERITEYFEIIRGELRAKMPLHLFMITSNQKIAESDCLCYLSAASTSCS